MTPEQLTETARTQRERQESCEHTIRVCMAAGCLSQGSDVLM